MLTDFDAMLSFGNAMSLFEADISASEDGEDEALGAVCLLVCSVLSA